MRNTRESSTRPSTRSDRRDPAESPDRPIRSGLSPSPSSSSSSSSSSPPANAFSQRFLLEASRREEISGSGPSRLTGGAFWAGPWEVEPVRMHHGDVWAVVRRGESLKAGGRAVWVIDPRTRTVTVHQPGCEPRHLAGDDVLDGAPAHGSIEHSGLTKGQLI